MMNDAATGTAARTRIAATVTVTDAGTAGAVGHQPASECRAGGRGPAGGSAISDPAGRAGLTVTQRRPR